MTQTIAIAGMTCANCVRHVSDALRALPGVRAVEVDLTSGSASLEADREIERDVLASALDEAGYTIA